MMKGVLLPGNKKVVVEEFPIPVPKDDEVLVKIKSSAICRSDLSLYYGNAVVQGDKAGKVITGHEPAGIIYKVGRNVKHIKEGDKVAIYLAIGCGHCKYCYQGTLHLCNNWECLGFTVDGGNAEYCVVPSRNALKVPDNMSYNEAAFSTDKFGTLYSAAKKLNVSGSGTIGVFGMGPMGVSGVVVCKNMGAQVVAVDIDNARREFAKSLGADHVLNPSDKNFFDQVMSITNDNGFDYAMDCSGNTQAHNAALDSLAKFGSLIMIGETTSSTINPSDQLIRKQTSIIGSWYFDINEFDEILDFIDINNIDLNTLISKKFSLDQAEQAFIEFDQRKISTAIFEI